MSEMKYRDERIAMPEPEHIDKGNREMVSPVIEGRMYEINRYIDSGGKAWAVKMLREDVNQRFYPRMDLESVFDLHVKEHELFMKHLGEFTLPAEFYKEIDDDGNVYFCAVQPWLEGGIQYKEAMKSKRQMPEWQLGSLEKRISFVNGLVGLIEESGKLPDLDFALTRTGGETEIKIFDTSYLYFERREGRDRANLARELTEFIFTENELKDQDVEEVVDKLFQG